MNNSFERVGEDHVLLETLKYADLQQLAKRCGIKANLKADKLRAALLEYRDTQSEGNQRLHTALLEYRDAQLQDDQSSNRLPTEIVPSDNETDARMSDVTNSVNSSTNDEMKENVIEIQNMQSHIPPDTNISFSVADQTETSILDISKECVNSDLEVTIRDHVAPRRSTFDVNEMKPINEKSSTTSQASAQKGPTSSVRKPRNWAAIHQRAFDKMDSLDVYIEKRQERYRSYMKTPPKRAAALSASLIGPLQKAREQITKQDSMIKPKVFVPSVLTTANINVNFSSMYKTPSAGTAVRFLNAGTGQKSINKKQLSKDVGPQTPNEVAANKSLSTSAVKPVFDLKASLAKPLGYTPHHGKLKPFAHVDVKHVTKSKSRERRREELHKTRLVQRQAAQMSHRQ